MFYNADGTQAFSDEIELLIEEFAIEKIYEMQVNEDNSKFWRHVADTISGRTLGGFRAGYNDLRDALLYNEKESKDLFDYTVCFTVRMRSKPFYAKALEMALIQVETIRGIESFSDVLDKPFSELDPLAELLLFYKLFGRVIERRTAEIAGGQVRLPRPDAGRES
jgi:hypothetical protein